MKHLSIVLLTVLAISCESKESVSKPKLELPVLTYLALGDSYTIGESVTEKERFPVILVDTLNKLNNNYNLPKIVAKTGWTTDELKAAIVAENIQESFNLVTLLIGVNNQYRGRDVEEFRTEFLELLNMAVAFGDNNPKNVIVISIPDWGVSPFAANRDRIQISSEIDAFNAVKKEETLKKGVKFVDITPISRTALNNADMIASDGLHFSGKMHQLWVNEILKYAF
jgi:lysophospholipase L1-like esterase